MEENIDPEVSHKVVSKVCSCYTSVKKLHVLITNAVWNMSFWILSWPVRGCVDVRNVVTVCR